MSPPLVVDYSVGRSQMKIGTLLNPDEILLIIEALKSLIENSQDTPKGKAMVNRCQRMIWQLEGTMQIIRA